MIRLFPVLLLAACAAKAPMSPAVVAKQLSGTWVDTGGATASFDGKGKNLVCTSVVDYDGEEFVITESGFRDGQFAWTYSVPSTGYVVTHTVTSVEDGVFTAHWANVKASGDETFTKR